MQASTTKIITTAALAAALIATLAGCVTQPDTTPAPTTAPTPYVSAEPAAPVAPAPAPAEPVTLTPELTAEIASGLSTEEYAAATAEVDTMVMDTITADVEAMSARLGKPVSIVVFRSGCGPTNVNAWGIGGELKGSQPYCITDKAEILEILGNRIERSDLAPTDHIVIFGDWTD